MAAFQPPAAIFVLLFAVGLIAGAAPALSQQELCAPFSCGKRLHNLTYPFRQRDDPPGCGEKLYQLSCSDEHAVMYLDGQMFYVTQVSYQNSTFRLVFPSSDDSTCRLPSPSLPPSKLRLFTTYWVKWVSFMNCTKPIQELPKTHVYISCLSHNNSFVYAAVDYYGILQLLRPTCRYLTMAPIGRPYDETQDKINLSTAILFDTLQKGFTLYLPSRGGHTMKYIAIHECIRQSKSIFFDQTRGKKNLFYFVPALVRSEYRFLPCISDYYYNRPIFWWALVVVVLIMIVELLIVALLVGRFLLSPLIICYHIGSIFWKRKEDVVEKFLRNQQRLSPLRYTYGDVVVMTRNFKEKLGQGGFGSVFKGELLGGVTVAVKMLSSSKYNGEEFISEVSTIGRIHHVNVVRLVGFCAEGSRRALIYEYMTNGSLDKLIFSSNDNHLYSSEKLIDIALGIARGIDYLHRGCEMQILHFDIKPHNILLDRNLIPKVSDFGLAKLYPKGNSLVSVSAARGTIGYIAPELISRSFGVISYKSDVYSFGMLLLEMAGGRRNVDTLAENSSRIYYPSWIYGRLDSHKDLDQGELMMINEVERRLSLMGLWCIKLKPSDRPTMSKIVEMLEDDVNNLTLPPKPFFSSMDPISDQQSYSNSMSTYSSIVTQSN